MILTPNGLLRATELDWGAVWTLELPPARSSTWAWLADTHIAEDSSAERNQHRPARELGRIVGRILAARPVGTLVNGDISWSCGERADYDRFLSVIRPLRSDGVVVLGLGNHDHRGNILSALSLRLAAEPERVAAVVNQSPARFVMLDSLVDSSETGGEIGFRQLAWLDALLSAGPALRTLLFVHHPGESSSVGARDFRDLERIAADHRCVQAIITGHEHEFALSRGAGWHRIGLPSAGFPFHPGTPCGWVQARLGKDRFALRFHAEHHSHDHLLDWRP